MPANEWISLFSIEPTHRLPTLVPDSFLEMIRSWLQILIPPQVTHERTLFFQWLKNHLPLVWSSNPGLSEEESSPVAVSLFFLYPASSRANLERYIHDILFKRLIPGTGASIVGEVGLQFHFTDDAKEEFYFQQLFIGVENHHDKNFFLKKVATLSHEMKINMKALSQGRHLQLHQGIDATFMPRNEEELLKNLVLLSKEIQYVKDLPQASIHYERQSEHHLIFIVLLVRLKLPDAPCFHQIFSDRLLRCEVDEVRLLGHLRRKYAKEAAILHVYVEKTPFFRPDFSIDLLRARQRVAAEISSALNGFRDFNGGMILKQEENLRALRKLLGPLLQQNDLLLENYFYSLRPVIAQAVHDPSTLKSHFNLLLKNMDVDLGNASYQLFSDSEGAYELYFLFAPKIDARKMVRELKKEPYRCATSVVPLHRMTALGWIVKKDMIDWREKIERLMMT